MSQNADHSPAMRASLNAVGDLPCDKGLIHAISREFMLLAEKHVPTSQTAFEFCMAVSMTLGLLCAGWTENEMMRLELVNLCRSNIRDAAFSNEGQKAAELLVEVQS